MATPVGDQPQDHHEYEDDGRMTATRPRNSKRKSGMVITALWIPVHDKIVVPLGIAISAYFYPRFREVAGASHD